MVAKRKHISVDEAEGCQFAQACANTPTSPFGSYSRTLGYFNRALHVNYLLN